MSFSTVIFLWMVLILAIILLIFLLTFFYSTLLTGFYSAPYVPTSSKDIDMVLCYAKLKKGMQFVDLGCGDGRLVITAVKQYQVNGTGVEINLILIWFGRIWAKILHLDGAVFLCQDLYSFPLVNAQVVYLFLMPKMMPKMVEKIERECRKGTLIISRGFEVAGLRKVHEIEAQTFWTYFYRV